MVWLAGVGILVLWFVLTVLLHKGGLIHVLLIGGISTLVVQFVAYRKTKYEETRRRSRG